MPYASLVWESQDVPLSAAEYEKFDGVLQIVEEESDGDQSDDDESGSDDFHALPHNSVIVGAEKRRGGQPPVFCTLPGGTVVIRLKWQGKDNACAQMESVRQHIEPLLSCKKVALDVRVPAARQLAVYSALVSASPLPGESRKAPKFLFAGCEYESTRQCNFAAFANTFSRILCRVPPNILSVAKFAELMPVIADAYNLSVETFDYERLQGMGADAIVAVGRSAEHPPQIIRVRYTGKQGAPHIALVGKGVCYDTGGVNVKSALHMRGMKRDMAGAAAALSVLVGASLSDLEINIDAWLVLAENAIGPRAYRPDEVVTALSGKRIEVVHSDAEGRMILADALYLATSAKPEAVVSFATLTGTMKVALGNRMSGAFTENARLRDLATAAAENSGERLCFFPAPDDYKKQLKSDVADIKQCAEEGDADHILAALFLREFICNDAPWLHLDLSAASCKGGLGAAPGPETGFGTAWALALLKLWDE